MTDYQPLYTLLFNAITDAVEQLDRQNYGAARRQLLTAQQAAEELYVAQEE